MIVVVAAFIVGSAIVFLGFVAKLATYLVERHHRRRHLRRRRERELVECGERIGFGERPAGEGPYGR